MTIGEGRVAASLLLAVLAVVGGALLVMVGLAISGAAKTENTAAPVANIISIPMMFLSGVFFHWTPCRTR